MSNKTPDPESVPLPQLSQEQLNRLLAADYLRSLAELITRGEISGFDIAWDARLEKPVGRVVMSTRAIKGPLELKLMAQIKEYEDSQRNKIPVQDLSAELQHEKCDDEDCVACNNPHQA